MVVEYARVLWRLQRKEVKREVDKWAMDKLIEWQDEEFRSRGMIVE